MLWGRLINSLPFLLKRIMKTAMNNRQHSMYGISLILAPLLQTISTFFWKNGEYGIAGGTILMFSIAFFIPGLVSLFSLVKDRLPNYSAWGLLIAVFGFISGANFAFLGVIAEIFNISHQSYIDGFAKYSVASNLLLFQSGPLAPLSLIILGIVLLRTKSVDSLLCILIILGGIAFPLSRISRTLWIAHTADLLLLIPLAIIGMRILDRNKN